MKSKSVSCVALLATLLCSCGSKPEANNDIVVTKPTPLPSIAAPASPTPVPTPSVPKDGDYNAKGIVTKINLDLASVEVDHEEIRDMMPAMKMEFFVAEKKLLNAINVGDRINFVIRYKHPTETIVDIKKAQ
jgi:Cu/Ag efflux protein CusF